MKQSMLLIGGLLLLAQSLYAQPRGDGQQQEIEAFRIAMFTRYLDLTPEESQVFWPVYNQMQDERQTLERQFDADGFPDQFESDEAARQFVDRYFAYETAMLDLRRRYFEKFSQTIGVRKAALLPNVERAFKKRLLREIRERRQGNGRRGRFR